MRNGFVFESGDPIRAALTVSIKRVYLRRFFQSGHFWAILGNRHPRFGNDFFKSPNFDHPRTRIVEANLSKSSSIWTGALRAARLKRATTFTILQIKPGFA
jgi:hypothetical protein